MMYLAVYLGGNGALLVDKKTHEPLNHQLGEFDGDDEAIQNACEQLECQHVHRGVITKGYGLGGFMVMNEQEFSAI
ncbi:TPA: hypothetical protein K4M41_004447 [Vibrio parahaemolyticus]|uniref:hypothetical protein n=1 Tax=uncultured Paraglaciecola sp. TaxID=1765024 RepID=UPI001C7C8C82|nr:hypothetical protein [uncultured Paraglaciecola sp.]HBI3715630.1 hypothetical protein [Vibrio parahaemolyticus]